MNDGAKERVRGYTCLRVCEKERKKARKREREREIKFWIIELSTYTYRY